MKLLFPTDKDNVRLNIHQATGSIGREALLIFVRLPALRVKI
ncbi:Uncharacterised protein [Enterobacter cloacae]|nr:Uncharacterised protein [Enterobacter cloacae]